MRKLALAMTVAALIGATACEPADTPENPNPGINRPQDVRGLKCTYGKFRSWDANYTVVNPIQEDAVYRIEITVYQAGTNKIQDTGPDTVRMGPGSKKSDAGGYRDKNKGGNSYCKVTKAIRTRG